MRGIGLMLALLSSNTAVHAAVPTPARAVTDPKAIVSQANPAAKPVPLADLGYTRGLLSAIWSADGHQLFLSTNLTGRYNIWRTQAAGSWPVQLTQADDRQSGLLASPDGKTIYFNQDRGGDEKNDIFAVPAAGGAVRKLTSTPDIDETGVEISPDGTRILVAFKPKLRAQTDVAVLDVVSAQLRVITDERDPAWSWEPIAWIDGGKSLIANRVYTDTTASEVWQLDSLSGKGTRLLGRPKTFYFAVDATSDGKMLSVTTNEKSGQMQAAIFHAVGNKFDWLKPTPWEQRAGAIAPDGRSMVVSTGIDGRTELSLVDLATMTERALALPVGANSVGSAKPFTPDSKKLLVLQSGATSPGAPVILDLVSGQVEAPIQLSMASLDPATLPRSAIVTFRSFDGTLVSGVLTIPYNLKRDGMNPAVVMPHGGPTGQASDSFSRTATALASRGYLVIQPNPRGSTGYGHAFQVANYQDLGGGDLKDELAAKDFLVATGYVDPRRVGITGGSYGGFMTLMAIGRAPDAFAAAVQSYGIIDWRTMWQNEDAGLQAYQKSLLGEPSAFPKVYDASSPLTYIKAAKAPLLSLQGENDIRVPRGQAQQVTDAIKAKGGIAEVVFYAAEGHGFAKRENQMDALQRTIDWFDKYLKPRG